MITWEISKEDAQVISKIVDRAKNMGVKRDREALSMDIQAAHEKCPLRLKELLQAENFDFLHDVIGIVNHLDRVCKPGIKGKEGLSMKKALLVPWVNKSKGTQGYTWENTREQSISKDYPTKEEALKNKPSGYDHRDDGWGKII